MGCAYEVKRIAQSVWAVRCAVCGTTWSHRYSPGEVVALLTVGHVASERVAS